ncbi:CDP-diacylglycerol--glycerol-3-phosphate 3-phosphatidyltransferase [Candidatus Poriferisodalis sp.]|uniref:CDP-diacylglycerol--glycerol-3-phosphate 3-phosphatidyltransferase n=1 Tax=Candidatus Poriferisodalis sp. TaxID=3101277 RepID=UPI003B02AED0
MAVPNGEDTPATFGPTALVTPANLVTIARIAASPVFIAMVVLWGARWSTFAVGFTIAMTDYVDGLLARRHGATRAGAFLDPLADKVLVLGGMAALVANGQFNLVPVVVIAVRELAVSGYRSRAGRRGVTVPATKLAKWKTFVQLWAVGFAVTPPLAAEAHWVATATLWLALVLTLWTGWSYLRSARTLEAAQLSGGAIG